MTAGFESIDTPAMDDGRLAAPARTPQVDPVRTWIKVRYRLGALTRVKKLYRSLHSRRGPIERALDAAGALFWKPVIAHLQRKTWR